MDCYERVVRERPLDEWARAGAAKYYHRPKARVVYENFDEFGELPF